MSYTFFFNDPATTEIYTLSLHDALPIWKWGCLAALPRRRHQPGRYQSSSSWDIPSSVRTDSRRIHRYQRGASCSSGTRSEEHTSELQSLAYLVCRLLLEKKKKLNTHDKR